MNIEDKYLLLVQKMPEDIIQYIKQFIPLSTLVWLDKTVKRSTILKI